MTLARSDVRQLRDDLQPMLDELEKKIGFKLHLGNASYTGDIATFKLECSRIGTNGVAVSREEQDFKRDCRLYGLNPEDLHRKFTSGRHTYEIVGLQRKARTSPILCKRESNQKTYKFDEFSVKQLLEMSTRAPAALPTTPGKRSVAAILADLRQVECDLSPENLSCDGELPAWKVATRRSQLNQQRRKLVEELGREPTEAELFS